MVKKKTSSKNKKGKKEQSFLDIILPTSNIHATFGQRAADALSKWAGSWTFIISFIVILILWVSANTAWIIFGEVWDSYPFILLNLMLSCVAALQAPIILMSQNRQAERDRIQAKYDYSVNRKAEREIKEMQKQLNRIERNLRKK